MKYCLSLLFTCAFVSAIIAQPEIQWQRALGGTDGDTPLYLYLTDDGGYLMLGHTFSNDGDVISNKGYNDIWLVKLNGQGDIMWKRLIGGSGGESPTCKMVETSDGGYILGCYTSSDNGDVSFNHGSVDCWIIKLDNNGVIQWEKTYGGTQDDYMVSIQPTTDGGYIILGSTLSGDGDVTEYYGQFDNWVFKINATGELLWQKTLGGSNSEYITPNALLQTDDGGYLIYSATDSFDGNVETNLGKTDMWLVKLSPGGEILWQKSYGGANDDYNATILNASDGGYILMGLTTSDDGDIINSHGFAEALVLKIDESGTVQWSRCYGGSIIEQMNSIQSTSDGGYIMEGHTFSNDGDITGVQHGDWDEWIVKINYKGEIQWERTLGGTAEDRFGNVLQTNDGGYLVSTVTQSNDGDVTDFHGSYDIWLVQLDSSGNTQWQKTFGGSATDYSYVELVQTPDGGFVFAGTTYSNDGDVSGFNGPDDKEDIWLVKLAPETVAVADINSTSIGLQLSPNPATQFVRVSVNTPETSLTLIITDILGLELSRQTVLNGGKLDVSGLPVGCYFVTFATQAGKLLTQKLIKEL